MMQRLMMFIGIASFLTMFAGCGNQIAPTPDGHQAPSLGGPGWTLEWNIPQSIQFETPIEITFSFTVPFSLTNTSIHIDSTDGISVTPAVINFSNGIMNNIRITETLTIQINSIGEIENIYVQLHAIHYDDPYTPASSYFFWIENGTIVGSSINPTPIHSSTTAIPMEDLPYPVMIATPEIPSEYWEDK